MGYEIPNPQTVASRIKALTSELGDFSGDVQVRVRRSPFLVQLTFREKDQDMAGFTLLEMPNCCGALVSTRTYVTTPFQKQGIAQGMMPLKIAIAREYGYSALAATVNETGNPAEVHILTKLGWIRGWSFTNRRTRNTVAFWFKEVSAT
jgi:GNAT superfamily N-acetyltransferase